MAAQDPKWNSIRADFRELFLMLSLLNEGVTPEEMRSFYKNEGNPGDYREFSALYRSSDISVKTEENRYTGTARRVSPDIILASIEKFTPDFIHRAEVALRKSRLWDDGWYRRSDAFGGLLELLNTFAMNAKGSFKDYLETYYSDSYSIEHSFFRRFESFLIFLILNPFWHPLLKTLPSEHQYQLWNIFCNRARFCTCSFNWTSLRTYFLENFDHPDLIYSYFGLNFEFLECGIKGVNKKAFNNGTIQGSVLNSILLFSEGQKKGAAKEILNALKIAKEEYMGDLRGFGSALSDVLLAVLLFEDRGTPMTLKRMAAILKRWEDFYNPVTKRFIRIVFTYVEDPKKIQPQDHEEMVQHLKSVQMGWTTIIAGVLYKIFRLDCYKDVLVSALKNNQVFLFNFYLLQAIEFVNPESDQLAELHEKFGMHAFLWDYTAVSDWQFELEKLLTLTKTLRRPKKSESKARIVYVVDPMQGDVSPYKQKSRDGISWSKGTPLSPVALTRGGEGIDEIDLQIGAKAQKFGNRYYLGGVPVFNLLAGTGRTFRSLEPEIPLEIKKDKLRIQVSKDANGNFVTTTNEDFCDEECLEAPVVALCKSDQITVFENSEKERKILKLLRSLKTLPKEAEKSLTQVLENLSVEVPVSSELLKSSSGLEAVKSSSKITFRIVPSSTGKDFTVSAFVRPVVGCAVTVWPGEGLDAIAAVVKNKPMRILRDLKAEVRNWNLLEEALSEFQAWQTESNEWSLHMEHCLQFMEVLRVNAEHCEIEWPEDAKFVIRRPTLTFSDFHFHVNSVDRWFSLDGSVAIDGKTQLKVNEILDRLKDRVGNYILLKDNEYVAVTDKLRKHLEKLEDISVRKRGELKLSRFNVNELEELKENGAQLVADQEFETLTERIEKAEETDYPVPESLQQILRSYQVEGFEWISKLCEWGAGGILADDMGLGKTIQAIALMESRKEKGPTLLVVPTAVLYNWKSEFERFAPQLKVVDFNGGDRRKILKNLSDYNVILCTYGVLSSEIESLKMINWDLVVLDEAHYIKNRSTQMSRAVMQLNSWGRLLLSGTPIQNDLSEIWNLFEFANPGYLGSYEPFGKNFIIPIEKDKNKQKQFRLKQLISPFILRRTKSEVLDELPEKTELIVPVELSEEEMAVYENIRSRTLNGLTGNTVNPIEALMALTQLRQAACSPELLDRHLKLTSSKINVFLELAKELIENKHRALVFSQFTSFLELVRKALDEQGIKYLYLDGSTSASARKKLVEEFQNGDMPLFLISLKAGGTGLNLTAADYVIHMDPWWNPAIEDQASDRAYRIGQKRPVTIYKLISRNTVETKILKLHKTKKNLADALLEGSDVAKKLSKDEILELLQSGS